MDNTQTAAGQDGESDIESVLAKKKALKKQRKAAAAAAAAGLQAGPAQATQQQATEPQTAVAPPPQALPQAATALLQQPDPVPKKHKKKQKLEAKASATTEPAVPLASAGGVPMQADIVQAAASEQNGDAAQPPAAKKRRVRFAMKRNLLMQIGGAVPPQEVRTPPGSRPKVALPQHRQVPSCTTACNGKLPHTGSFCKNGILRNSSNGLCVKAGTQVMQCSI